MTVNDLNDAPELTDGTVLTLGTISEDDAPAGDAPAYSSLTTYQVSSVVTGNVYTDTDTTLLLILLVLQFRRHQPPMVVGSVVRMQK